ncbi:zeta toxin family protein [Liquorilactobacillus satsumensis]|uniref:UDP-N-acetylglucosamine kinase n=1 Tax=Liquorilactobacillus satsumensis DSM 16230 = JCM 12392 TaxID=1423801 RepID=A0A0R1UV97_9LACO|nr:zeta toxin family protein [Liquorilactobacillus satsumensis]KRL97105.1 hypothetical protein FD50_GL001656 [Liquorilactobacillus satsumensis DSM 16230 = JCM 12392]
MNKYLIIIRGNSGSGKTTLAQKLQTYFGSQKCLLLQQDVLRRDFLHTNDHLGTPAVDLLETLIHFGESHYQITILEGILRRDVYGKMLQRVCRIFAGNVCMYYLDVPFEVTLQHNNEKPQPFTTELLQSWWREKDYLNSAERRLSKGGTNTFFATITSEIVQAHDDF